MYLNFCFQWVILRPIHTVHFLFVFCVCPTWRMETNDSYDSYDSISNNLIIIVDFINFFL